MASVIMCIGIPGTGKSTFSKKIAQWGSFENVGPDALRHEKYGDEMNHSDDEAIWVELRSRVVKAIQSNRTIVIDTTFHTKERRAHFLEFARTHGATSIEGLYFDISLEVALARNAGRGEAGGKLASSDYIRQAYAELQDNLPMPEEGFDALLRIDAEGKVTSIKNNAIGVLSSYLQPRIKD